MQKDDKSKSDEPQLGKPLDQVIDELFGPRGTRTREHYQHLLVEEAAAAQHRKAAKQQAWQAHHPHHQVGGLCPPELLPAQALLLRPETNTPASYGFLARLAGLPQLVPTDYPFRGVAGHEGFWRAGYHTAHCSTVAAQQEGLDYLVGPAPDLNQILGRPGDRLRDLYAFRELAAQAYRQDPHVEQVPVISIEVEGQGSFTAPLAQRLAFEQLAAFLCDAGVLGDDTTLTDTGPIRYHLWTPRRLAQLPEWPA